MMKATALVTAGRPLCNKNKNLVSKGVVDNIQSRGAGVGSLN